MTCCRIINSGRYCAIGCSFDLNYLFPVAIVPIIRNLFILVKKNIDEGRIGPDLVAQFLTGIFIQLMKQKFIDTKDLTNYFPTDLLKETETIIGQPDARDCGGLYVEYNFNGVRERFT